MNLLKHFKSLGTYTFPKKTIYILYSHVDSPYVAVMTDVKHKGGSLTAFNGVYLSKLKVDKSPFSSIRPEAVAHHLYSESLVIRYPFFKDIFNSTKETRPVYQRKDIELNILLD